MMKMGRSGWAQRCLGCRLCSPEDDLVWEGRKKGARGAPWDSGLFPAMAVVFQGGEAGSASGLWGGGLVQAEKHTRRCSKATVSGQSCVPESPDWGRVAVFTEETHQEYLVLLRGQVQGRLQNLFDLVHSRWRLEQMQFRACVPRGSGLGVEGWDPVGGGGRVTA